jgi:hypothetical protein
MKSFLYAVILSVVALFVVFIVFISILGENHKTDEIVNDFFKKINKGEYIEATQFLSKQKKESLANNNFSELFFLLELSLLKKYNLMDKNDYKIKSRRSQFWLPFTNRDRIGVSILLEDVKKREVFNTFSSNKHSDYIDNLITVKREDGVWRIVDINIDAPAIKNTYEKFESLLNENRVVKIVSDRVIELQNKKINFNEIKSFEKRILKYFFYEVIDEINGEHTKSHRN